MKLTIKQLKQLIKEQVKDAENSIEDPERDHRLERDRIRDDMEQRRDHGLRAEELEQERNRQKSLGDILDKFQFASAMASIKPSIKHDEEVDRLKAKILTKFGGK